jgi:hypothetical protein
MDEGCGPKSSNLSKYVSVLPSPRGLFFIKKDQLGQNWPGSSSNVDSKSHFVRCYINSLSLQLKLRVPPGELTPVSIVGIIALGPGARRPGRIGPAIADDINISP